MTALTLILVFLIYVMASYATYNESFRNSSYYTPLMLCVATISALLWSMTVRRYENPASIAVLSLCWDLIIVSVYSILPLLLFGRGAGWQFYVALSMSVFGLMWLKMLMEE
jgi:hypothetical protein